LRIFTFLSLDEIGALMATTATDPAGRAAQRALATEATRIMHGDDGVKAAEAATAILFGNEAFADLDDRTLGEAFESAPATSLPDKILDDGVGLLSLMVSVGAAGSNGEARRLVEQGGVSLNNASITDPGRVLGRSDLASETTLVLRVGKKRYFLVRFGA